MLRRKTSERKAAAQALQVIAESIRACRGRGGRKPAEIGPKLEAISATQSRLRRSQSEMEARCMISDIPRGVITRKDSMISGRSQSEESRKANKENFGPNPVKSQPQPDETLKKRGRKCNGLKSQKMINDDQMLALSKAQDQAQPNIYHQMSEESMHPPATIDRMGKNTLNSSQASIKTVPKDDLNWLTNSKQKGYKGTGGGGLQMQLQIKKSHSLFNPEINPHENRLGSQIQESAQIQAPKFSLPDAKLDKEAKELVSQDEEDLQFEDGHPQQQVVSADMNNLYEPQKKDINQSILSKKNNNICLNKHQINEPKLIIKQTYLMHQTSQQKEKEEAPRTVLDSQGVKLQKTEPNQDLTTTQNEGSNQSQSERGTSQDNEDNDFDDENNVDGTQSTGERQAMAQEGGAASGLSGSQGRWTDEEHDKFLEGMRLFGKDWRRIEEYIGTRSCAQIRSHAQKYFNRLQRDLAKGIKRPDAEQAAMILGKKKRKHSGERKFSQQSANGVLPPPIKQLRTSAPAVGFVSDRQPPMTSPAKESQIFTVVPSLLAKPQVETVPSVPLSFQTNQQIQKIQETLTKLTEDELVVQLQQLIGQREQISIELIDRRLPRELAGQLLVELTNRFHQLAMQALNQCKFDICNRMIDERNLTQFVCILLSRQVIIEPAEQSQLLKNSGGQEIIQQVDFSPKRVVTLSNPSLSRVSQLPPFNQPQVTGFSLKLPQRQL